MERGQGGEGTQHPARYPVSVSRPRLGFREYASLAILLAAATATFALFRDGDSAHQDAAQRFLDGPPFDSPHVPIQGEGPWQVTWFVAAPAGDNLVSDISLDRLEFDDAGPAEAVRQGGAVKARALMVFSGPPGKYHLRLRYQGSAMITQDGRELIRTAGASTEVQLFLDVGGSPSTITVEVSSLGSGPIAAHWSMVRTGR